MVVNRAWGTGVGQVKGDGDGAKRWAGGMGLGGRQSVDMAGGRGRGGEQLGTGSYLSAISRTRQSQSRIPTVKSSPMKQQEGFPLGLHGVITLLDPSP